MRVALISLARRGGMVHYHGALVNSLSEIAPIISITAQNASSFNYAENLTKLSIDTGVGRLGTLLNAVNPLTWYRLMKILKESKADLFHLTVSHEWNPLIGFLIKILGKPLVFSIHDPEHHLGAPLYMKISDKITARISDSIVVLSKLGEKQLLLKGFPQDRLNYIPLGVPTFFSENNVKPIDQEKMILFFGRIEPYKGVELLLNAFTRLADLLPEWKLVVAGNGDVSSYSAYLNHPQIEVLNRFIEDDEISNLMQRASVVALPYIEATQSAVIPIAYAFARPVIATNVGSLKESIVHGKTGLLISPNSVEELAEAIKKITTNHVLREQMGEHAYKMSRTEWNWRDISISHLKLYNNIINQQV